ncbi:MAG: hypothetical protein K6F33_00880 [Bacteroidales bacterium]|nr:hypothetical protein [Bacteroidales bacterium]
MKKFLLMLAAILTLTLSVQAQSDTTYKKIRLGGYGEILGSWQNYGLNRWASTKGKTEINHAQISIPRFVLALDCKLSEKWILGAEIEFEAGGTGMAMELETGTGSENGEYETEIEKGGEVALEQFHITREIVDAFNIRVGHVIVPVGLTNTHHEPINFYTTFRPEGATTLIPCTWHETGLEFFGKFGNGYAKFDYQAQVVAGQNPLGFSRYNWIKGGKQGFFEADNFTRPAYVLRIDYNGVPGLRLGTSMYYCHDAGKNCDRLITFNSYDPINVKVFSIDAQYKNRYITARGNYLQGKLTESLVVDKVIRTYSSGSGYNRSTNVAAKALNYNFEIGCNLKSIFNGGSKFPVIHPFVHYEYYNPQEEGEGNQTMDDRCQVNYWAWGINYFALPNLVIKADYTLRKIGTDEMFKNSKSNYNNENEFCISIAYVGWFWQK